MGSNHKWSCDTLVSEHPNEHHGGYVTKHALYRFFDDAGQLLYVGITNDPPRRMSQHADSKPWWPQVRGMTVDWYDTRAMVAAAERRAIRVENPLNNIQHKPDVPRLGNYIDGMSSPDIDLYEDIAGYYRKIFRGTEDQWTVFSEGLQKAVRDGYSRPEITEAIRSVASSNDPNVCEFLPAYPGHLLDFDEINSAIYELSLYVEAEVRKFRAIATGEEGMERAHWHEITIRAAEIADELLEEEGRDRQTLLDFLHSLPGDKGERAIDQAHEEFNAHQGRFPVEREADEVLDLAIANYMGVMVPITKASFQSN